MENDKFVCSPPGRPPGIRGLILIALPMVAAFFGLLNSFAQVPDSPAPNEEATPSEEETTQEEEATPAEEQTPAAEDTPEEANPVINQSYPPSVATPTVPPAIQDLPTATPESDNGSASITPVTAGNNRKTTGRGGYGWFGLLGLLGLAGLLRKRSR